MGRFRLRCPPSRFADIACGSGSFLLGVFDLLLTYHGQYYNDNPNKARKGDCIKHDGKLYLSLRKKREILLNNIYGVDIDAQAVEVCQLSLYLKLLKDETTASAHQYLLEFEQAAQMKKLLPDLSKNILCGNSLIGRDILEGQLFPSEEERKLNPLDIEDGFPAVMKRGGFDAIVGNPPYVNAWDFFENQPIARQFINDGSHYKTADRHWDLYVLFLERAYQLTKQGGRFSFIIGHLEKYPLMV
jgi:adenine-specific DNA-methyltransferase